MTKTVIQIVAQHLSENGFTGLVNTDAPCGCKLGELRPCGTDFSDCRPGHLHMDPRPDHAGDWAVFTSKEEPTAEQWERIEY